MHVRFHLIVWASGDQICREVIIKEHWASSGFANTDLDLQLKMLILEIGDIGIQQKLEYLG
jgi:nicotinamidase-related amidase